MLLLKGKVKSPSVLRLGNKDWLGEWVWKQSTWVVNYTKHRALCTWVHLLIFDLSQRLKFRLDLGKRLVHEGEKPIEILTFIWCLSDNAGDLRNPQYTACVSPQIFAKIWNFKGWERWRGKLKAYEDRSESLITIPYLGVRLDCQLKILGRHILGTGLNQA